VALVVLSVCGQKRVEKLNNLIRQNRKAQLSASRQLHARREEKN